MQWARANLLRGRRAARSRLARRGIVDFRFLGGQFFAWQQLEAAGFFSPRNPALAFFYLLTAVHGLHLLGGLFVWAKTLQRMRRREFELIEARLSIELCAIYWHYLLIVWLVLFALLLSLESTRHQLGNLHGRNRIESRRIRPRSVEGSARRHRRLVARQTGVSPFPGARR